MSYEVVRLGDVCKVTGGFAFKSTDYLEEGIPLIRIGNIGNEKIDIKENTVCVDEKFLSKCKNFIVNKGDILVALSGATTGKFGIYNLDDISLLNQRVGRIIPNLEKLDNKFILFILYVLKDKILSSAGGAAQPNISPKEIENFQIPLPPLDIQKKIADTLDKAQELIDKRKEQISALDKFLENLFLDMFGDIRFGSNKWDILTLEELSTKITDGVHNKPNYINAGVPFISVKDMNRGVINFSNTKFISEEDHNKYKKRCFPEKGDILYTKVGATYGIPAIVDTDIEFSLYVSVALIKIKRELINPMFLKAQMKTVSIKFQADSSIKGIGVPDLHLIEIKKFKIIVPPMEKQLKFASIVEKVEAEKTKLEASLKKMEDNFNSIMQRAFKGELF